MERIVLPPPKRTFYLAHLGVNRASTGQGIGTQLIDYLLQQGRDAGFSITALDVSAGNPLAQRLYERLGFVVQIERAHTYPALPHTVTCNGRSELGSRAAPLNGYAGGKPANEPAPHLRTVVARL